MRITLALQPRPMQTQILSGPALIQALSALRPHQSVKIIQNGAGAGRIDPAQAVMIVKSGTYEGVVCGGKRQITFVDRRPAATWSVCWRTSESSVLPPALRSS